MPDKVEGGPVAPARVKVEDKTERISPQLAAALGLPKAVTEPEGPALDCGCRADSQCNGVHIMTDPDRRLVPK